METADCGISRRGGGDGDSPAWSACAAGCCHQLRGFTLSKDQVDYICARERAHPNMPLSVRDCARRVSGCIRRCHPVHRDTICVHSKRAIWLFHELSESAPQIPVSRRRTTNAHHLRSRLAEIYSRAFISFMRSLWSRGAHRMFSASGYSSYRVRGAFSLSIANLLYEANRRIVASKVPLCARRACDRSWYSSRRCIFFCRLYCAARGTRRNTERPCEVLER